MSCIVADSGPLIALAKLGYLDFPARVLGRALLPAAVYGVCLAGARRPAAEAIRHAVAAGLLELAEDVPWPEDIVVPRLDAGESAALASALRCRVGVLLDEQRGRKAARRLGVPVIGVCGLLLLAKSTGRLAAVAPALDRLRAEGYFIAPELRAAVLERAGESEPPSP